MGLFGGGDDLASVADDIFGKSELPDVGRVVARPTPILSIWRDPKQPRRAIPLTISMNSDCDPLSVMPMLSQWQAVAQQAAGQEFDVLAMINGEGEGLDTDKFPSVTQEFIETVRLAAHIKSVGGLINPITVIESDNRLLIETGERRYLAYHLLSTLIGEQWDKIPAIKADSKNSLWRQAGENTKRRNLNAIGLARQFAMLLMDVRGTPAISEGALYKDYEEIVSVGVCDRRYYAQVADGNRHSIPRGMGEKIQSAMGDLSKEQLSQYRALLKLTDDEQINDILWVRGDIENWPESTMRDIGRLTVVNLRSVLERPNWTLDDLKALKTPTLPFPIATGEGIIPRRPVTSEWMNKMVITKGNLLCKVIGVDSDWIKVMQPNGQAKNYHYTELTISGDKPGVPAITTPSASHGEGNITPFVIGDKVRTQTGMEGSVVGIGGRQVGVRTINGTAMHDYTLLTKINPVPKYVEPVIDEADIEEDVEPDAPAPAREWVEGYGFGSRDEIATDKADSQSQLAQKIIRYQSNEIRFLQALRHVAATFDDAITETMINGMIDMTDQEVKAMSTEELQAQLNQAFDAMQSAMGVWLNKHFVDVLMLIKNSQ